MKVLEVAQELMRFKSETGNDEEIKKTFDYIKNMMSLIGGKVDIFEKRKIVPQMPQLFKTFFVICQRTIQRQQNTVCPCPFQLRKRCFPRFPGNEV